MKTQSEVLELNMQWRHQSSAWRWAEYDKAKAGQPTATSPLESLQVEPSVLCWTTMGGPGVHSPRCEQVPIGFLLPSAWGQHGGKRTDGS